jgi:hypothetical protein
MAWIKAGTTTLGSAGDSISLSGLSGKFLQTILHTIDSGAGITGQMQFNSDTASNYADRVSNSGGGDVTHNLTYMIVDAASADCFHISYLLNIATEEKLQIGFSVDQSSTGAGTAPVRREIVGKWVNTSNAITSAVVNNGGGGDFDTNSNITVLGSDGTESLGVQDGAIYYDTDLNKEYVLYNNTWTEI